MAFKGSRTRPDGLRAVPQGHFSKKQGLFKDQIGLKLPADKRKPLLFFTIVL
jgi:hypothetical protein